MSRWKTHGKSNFDRNFDRKFFIFDRFVKKQYLYYTINNVCGDRRLKIESSPLPANKKQWNENHRSLLACLYRLPLLLGYNSSAVVSFIRSFIHSFIHSKINCEGQEHFIFCKLIRFRQVDHPWLKRHL